MPLEWVITLMSAAFLVGLSIGNYRGRMSMLKNMPTTAAEIIHWLSDQDRLL